MTDVQKLNQAKLNNAFLKLQEKRNIQFITKDVVLISYPKSGRTWIRMMLTKLLLEMGHSNDKYEMLPAMHAQPRKINDQFTTEARIIFLYRNIGDVIMSFFWESITSDRNGIGVHASPDKFIRGEKFGLPNVVKYYNLWFDNIDHFKDRMFLTYEDLQHDTLSSMERVVKFISTGSPEAFTNYTTDKLKNAIEYSRFENMRKMEHGLEENLLQNYKGNFGSFGVTDKDAMKLMQKKQQKSLIEWLKDRDVKDEGRIRKGKVDGYMDDLDAESIDFIRLMESMINWPT